MNLVKEKLHSKRSLQDGKGGLLQEGDTPAGRSAGFFSGPAEKDFNKRWRINKARRNLGWVRMWSDRQFIQECLSFGSADSWKGG